MQRDESHSAARSDEDRDESNGDEPNVLTKPFGDQLRWYRKNRLDISQAQLAKAIDVSESLVWDLEMAPPRLRRPGLLKTLLAVLAPVLSADEKAAFSKAWRVQQRVAAARSKDNVRQAKAEQFQRLLEELHPEERLIKQQQLDRLIAHSKWRWGRVQELEGNFQTLRIHAESAATRAATLEEQCQALDTARRTLVRELEQRDTATADLTQQQDELREEAERLRARNQQLEAAVGRLSSLVRAAPIPPPTPPPTPAAAAAAPSVARAVLVISSTRRRILWEDVGYYGLALMCVLLIGAYPLFAAEPDGWLSLTVGWMAPPSKQGGVASLYTGDLRLLWSAGVFCLGIVLGLIVIEALLLERRTRAALGTLGLVSAAALLLLSYLLPDTVLWMWETGAAMGLLATTTLGLLLPRMLNRQQQGVRVRVRGKWGNRYLRLRPHPLPLVLLLLYIGGLGAAIAAGLVPLTTDGQGLSAAGIGGAMVCVLLGEWLRLRLVVYVGHLGLSAQAIIYCGILLVDHLSGYPLAGDALVIAAVAVASALAGVGAGVLCRLADPQPAAPAAAPAADSSVLRVTRTRASRRP